MRGAAARTLVEYAERAEGVWQLYVQAGALQRGELEGFPEDVATIHPPGFPVPVICLDLGSGLARPPLVAAEDDALHVELSFGGVARACVIPWWAVLALMLPRSETMVFTYPIREPGEPEPTKPALRVV